MREQLLHCGGGEEPTQVTPASALPTVVMPRPSPEPSPMPTGGPIDPEAVKSIESRALEILGPVARLLVRKASASAGSLPELVERLASFVPSGKERTAFLTAFHATRVTPGATPARVVVPVAWDPALLDRLQRLLALHIGPVARIVVQRASKAAKDPLELYEIVASEITSETDRSAFLESLGPPSLRGTGPPQ